MPSNEEIITLIINAAQEGQFYKMSTEEMERIYNQGYKLAQARPYDEAFTKAIKQFKDEIEKRKGKQSTSTSTSIDDLISFIGKNAGHYVMTFKKFESDRSGKIQATWNWPAFFFGFWWFIYRKLYLWALFVFVINFMPLCTKIFFDSSTSGIMGVCFGILLMIIWGASANYIYYDHIKKKIAEIDSLQLLKTPRQNELASTGGVNRIGIVLPLMIFILGIIAAIAIPQFIMYKMRSNCEIARKDAKSVYTVAQAFYAQHPNENLSEINQLEAFGFKPAKNVTLQIINGGHDNLIISSACLGCIKTYYVDNIGIVSETMPQLVIPSAPAPAPVPVPAQITNTSEPTVSSKIVSSGNASIDDVQAVPYLHERGRMVYRQFLAHPEPRAFVVVKNGSSTTAYGGNDPLGAAMQSCRQQFHDDCEPYAVNDKVVWSKSTVSAQIHPAFVKSPDTVTSLARTPSSNSMPTAESGRILVKPGDTLNDVRNAYHTSAEPVPVSSTTPGATCLRLQDMGISFFFDRSGKIYVIRLDWPFNGTIKGVKIGDSSDKVIQTLGEPDPKPGRSSGHFYYFARGLHLLFNANGSVDAIFMF
ncbi:MAG TPA: DUF2628 domain-containing protein [Smithella sp.]|nr:DUF2628 domain-containing protein [Smithella sp.]